LKDRHIHNAHDSELLKSIYKLAEEKLVYDKSKFKLILSTKLIFYLLITGLSYWGLFNIANTYLFLFCFVLFGFAALLLAFNFAHDFSHGTIFRNSKWDNLGFTIIYALNGAHAAAWKERHIKSHHFAPNVDSYDCDLEISSLIRVIPNSRHSWFHKFQHLYAPIAYTSYSLFWVFIKDFSMLFTTGKHQGFPYHLSFWAQKIFYLTYLLVLPVMFSLQPWFIVLTGFLAMHLLQSLFLLFTFFITHHVEGVEYPTIDKDGYINTSWVMNQIKSSNDMYPYSTTANFIFGGFNNHIGHHLYPHVHHIYYPELNKLLYRFLNENGIEPNQTTYWGGVCSHLRLLKRMGIGSHEQKVYPAMGLNGNQQVQEAKSQIVHV
jgi:linoleoyl-CoA desaturase